MDTNTLSPKMAAATIVSARVAQFILDQTDIRDCVSFLINRENVI